jgi:2-polyprenyl-3-methyl-5-hydroxy-6-metoxy-1,4-benzoquinol methylase
MTETDNDAPRDAPRDAPKEDNPFVTTRIEAGHSAQSAQDHNRLWWELKPMTYEPWENEDRLPKDAAAFEAMEEYLLARSPFLSTCFDAAGLCGQRVLDLGCGSGVLSCYLAKNGADVTAADITDQGTALTSKNATLRNLPVDVVRTDAEAMGLADNSFDFVLSWGVLHHSENTERALAEVRRVLRPGGRGMMMVYHRNSLVFWLKGLYWLLARGRIFRGDTLSTATNYYADGYYHRHFQNGELAASLRSAGLTPRMMTATEQDGPILPGVSGWLDAALKARFGWYLVAEFEKPAELGETPRAESGV